MRQTGFHGSRGDRVVYLKDAFVMREDGHWHLDLDIQDLCENQFPRYTPGRSSEVLCDLRFDHPEDPTISFRLQAWQPLFAHNRVSNHAEADTVVDQFLRAMVGEQGDNGT